MINDKKLAQASLCSRMLQITYHHLCQLLSRDQKKGGTFGCTAEKE